MLVDRSKTLAPISNIEKSNKACRKRLPRLRELVRTSIIRLISLIHGEGNALNADDSIATLKDLRDDLHKVALAKLANPQNETKLVWYEYVTDGSHSIHASAMCIEREVACIISKSWCYGLQ